MNGKCCATRSGYRIEPLHWLNYWWSSRSSACSSRYYCRPFRLLANRAKNIVPE